ncbi:acyltransferase [Vibrio hepatarius]|uniref:acyltransferase n=1 Tax=Vibrio hepatarius TaxID=171383 RepID=UPI001C097780|nr:acyltransferase [Vibrio hepatarius]MBU2896912.1 acyltransferase [Vibrio hepatarius]
MKGRLIFKKLSFVIKLFVFLLKMFPKKLNLFVLDLFSFLPGKIGLFVRYLFLSSVVQSIGSNVYIGRWVVFKNTDTLSIGNNVSIHDNCYIDSIGGICIGDDVSIAHAASLISFEHTWNEKSTSIKYNDLKLNSIIVERDVWIGCGVRILSGARIGQRVAIAANSVVKGELNSNSLYVGSPVKKVKSL